MQAEEFENLIEYQNRLLTNRDRKRLKERVQLCIDYARGLPISIPDAQHLTEEFNEEYRQFFIEIKKSKRGVPKIGAIQIPKRMRRRENA